MKDNPTVPRFRAIMGIFRFSHDPIPFLMQYQKDYGKTYWAYLGGVKKALISSDPEFIKQVLQTKNKSYTKSELQTDLLAKYLGYGLLTSKGPYWLKQRRLIQPGFHKEKLKALSTILLNTCSNEISQLKIKAETNPKIDIYPIMLKMAFSMVANSLFNVKMPEKDLAVIESSISSIQQFIISQIRKPFLKPWYKLIGKEKKNLEKSAELKSLILKVIRERKASNQRNDDLLDMLIHAIYEDTGESMTEEQILWEAIIIFIAGHETTANALSWLFYLLAENPSVIEKIKTEVENEIGDEPINAQNLRKLTYINQVIKEGMRLYPPAWLTDRIAVSDDAFKSFNIKEGTMVIPFFYGAHHDSDFWKHPEEFMPERFESKKQEAYFPFGAGPRMCIGNNFAMMEMQIAIIQMVKNFELSVVKEQKVEMEALVTLRPKNGLFINLKPKQ